MEQERELIISLRERLKVLNHHYYDLDEPLVSDAEYDILLHRLRDLEAKYPDMYDPESPSVKVGGTVSSTFEKYEHKVQMQSLLDVFSFDEVKSFVEKIKKEHKNAKFSVEYKIDGLSILVLYENGKLKTGATRGDGFIGEDVTENIKQISDIPHTINYDGRIAFRGEVYMSKKSLEVANAEREENGEALFANARNAAAGSLRQLDPSLTKKRNLKCFIFNIQEGNFTSHEDGLFKANELGFKTVNSVIVDNCEDIIKEIERIGTIRDSLEYGIDGVVIKVNSIAEREEIGTASKYPKWAIAYKFPAEEKKTIVREIKLQVGRTGNITPVAIFDTVQLAGTQVSKATLHNFDYIKEKDIRIGDTIIVRKSGDIIPEVVKVIERGEGAEEYKEPTVCPVCGGKVMRDEENVALKCISDSCPAQLERNIIHFVSRDAMNIDGMGPAIVSQLLSKNIIKKVTDIYSVTKNEFLTLDKIKEKSAENLLNAIEKSKNCELYRVIYGLGIPLVGLKASKLICKNYNDDFNEMTKATVETLSEVSEIGPKIASSFIEYVNTNKEHIEELIGIMNIKKTEKIEIVESEYTGKTICVTGSFEGYSRKEIEEKLISLGAKVTGSVSKKTDILFCGEAAGSKLEKANANNVKIIYSLDGLF